MTPTIETGRAPKLKGRLPGIALLAAGLIVASSLTRDLADLVRVRQGTRLEQELPGHAPVIGLVAVLLIAVGFGLIRVLGRIRQAQVAAYAESDLEFAAHHRQLFSVRPAVWAISALIWVALAVCAIAVINWAANLGIDMITDNGAILVTLSGFSITPLAAMLLLFFHGADSGEQAALTAAYENRARA